MQPFGPGDESLAIQLYQTSPTATSRPFLDLMLQNPGDVFDSDEVQRRLGIEDHRDVARTTYALGEIAMSMQRIRPWNEGQRGYSMSQEICALFAGAN